MNLKLVSRSDGGAAFAETFSSLPEKLRKNPYRSGLLPAAVWQSFLAMPFPMPIEFWIAEKDGNAVGRVGANMSVVHPDTGFVGFFEVGVDFDGAAVSREMLEKATHWLKSKGARKIYGPLNVNTWFPYRFRVGQQDDLRFSWEPVNPPEFVDYFTAAGFKELERYHSQGSQGIDGLIEKTKAAFDKATAAGYTCRPFDGTKLLESEVPKLYEISMQGFKDNFLFEPIPPAAFKQLYVPIANKLDVSLARFVCDPKGKEIGFFFIFEDQGYMVLKSVAMLPEARGLGLSNAMTYSAAAEAKKRGLTKIISALVRSGAQSESYAKKSSPLWKHEYALFEKIEN